MKTLLLSALFVTSAFAQSADYVCGVQQYRVQLDLRQDLGTSMWFTDTVTQETLSQGYAGFIDKRGGKSAYHFYPASNDEMTITFKTQDTLDLPDSLQGYIETRAHGFLVWDTLSCQKN